MPEPRKRKHRHGAAVPAAGPALSRRERSEVKNEAVRAALVPLEEGERPAVVTVAAAVAFLLAAGNLAAWAAGLKVDGDRPLFATVAFQALLMGSLAYGMWRARYWAVLGMEAILAILIVILAVLLLKASTALTVVILVGLIVGAGAALLEAREGDGADADAGATRKSERPLPDAMAVRPSPPSRWCSACASATSTRCST